MEQAQIDNLRRQTVVLSIAHEDLNKAKRYRSHAAIALFEDPDYYSLLHLSMSGAADSATAQEIIAALSDHNYATAQELINRLAPEPADS